MPKDVTQMMAEQKQISISEFFEKNRHLLGYDNKTKALLMIVKEGVDNALDAGEEAGILPEIYVKVEELTKEKYRVLIKDNGPGIVKKQIPKIFGTLLYGSKFHRLRQSRGQQGLGVSVGVLYSQLTTGEATEVISSTANGKTHKYRLKIDVKKNKPEILSDEILEREPWHGTQINFICEGRYREHDQSILEYLKETAIANPYAEIIFDSPNGRVEFKRGVEELPEEPKEIKPHLHGVEVGIMSRMLKETKARTVKSFLTGEFTRVGSKSAKEILEKAEVDTRLSPKKVTDEDVRNILEAVKDTKLMRPPTDCLSPLGEDLIEEGLRKELNPEFVTAVTRSPTVYRGWPFVIEVGLAYGGSIEEPAMMRFANKVPLLYKKGDCAMTKAAKETDWRRYKVEADGMPTEPLVIFTHMASVWVPFTSESKEAVSSYPAIIKETKLAIQEAARRLSSYLAGVRRAQKQKERMNTFKKYAPETARALAELTGKKQKTIQEAILKLINSKIDIEEVKQKEEENDHNESKQEEPEEAE